MLVCASVFGVCIMETTRGEQDQQRLPGGVGGVQACIMTVGMRVPYMSLWERVT